LATVVLFWLSLNAPLHFLTFCETFPPLLDMRSLLRSKIHLATVTEANVDYVGSITIDQHLIERGGFWVGERVLVVSATTGARLETYVIEGEAGSGVIGINGAAAHLINAGEKVIIMGFEITDKPVQPKVILCDSENGIAEMLSERAGMILAE
jgi:aspartate 1-decarboxylase